MVRRRFNRLPKNVRDEVFLMNIEPLLDDEEGRQFFEYYLAERGSKLLTSGNNQGRTIAFFVTYWNLWQTARRIITNNNPEEKIQSARQSIENDFIVETGAGHGLVDEDDLRSVGEAIDAWRIDEINSFFEQRKNDAQHMLTDNVLPSVVTDVKPRPFCSMV